MWSGKDRLSAYARRKTSGNYFVDWRFAPQLPLGCLAELTEIIQGSAHGGRGFVAPKIWELADFDGQ